MTNISAPSNAGPESCLNNDDLYSFVTDTIGRRSRSELEHHLATCADCRAELAGLLQVLHCENGDRTDQLPAATAEEVAELLPLVCHPPAAIVPALSPAFGRRRWWAMAAAALVAAGMGAAGSFYLYTSWKSTAYLAEARSALRDIYAPASPGDLRLDLPFNATPTARSVPAEESAEKAERHFYQVLAIRENNRDALLGLGYLHLRRGRFAKAKAEFQSVLDGHSGDLQALLGRGVCLFEEAAGAGDPSYRATLLQDALHDFTAALARNPDSTVGRFNRARTLYELGRQGETLKEIEGYLALDPDSLWALKLKELRAKIRLSRVEAVDREVLRAAAARSQMTLENLVRLAPERIPAAIRSVLLQSLGEVGESRPGLNASRQDLQWAAHCLADALEETAGATGFAKLLAFYDGLSPPLGKRKHALDLKLERIVEQFSSGAPDSAALPETLLLQREFEQIRDHWQLVRIHQLRGTAFYYGRPDFLAARRAFAEMLHAAESSGDPDLIARALGALASSHAAELHYDDALACLVRLRKHASDSRLQTWSAFASSSIGALLLQLNRVEESVSESTAAYALACRVMDPQTILVSLESLGAAMERMRRFNEAAGFYRQEEMWQRSFLREGFLRETPETLNRRLNLLSKQGYLALQTGDLGQAEALFKQAVLLPAGNAGELEARSRIGLARVYHETKRHAEADAEIGRLREVLNKGEFPEAAWQFHTLAAIRRREARDVKSALDHLTGAIRALETIRVRIAPELRQSFFTGRFNPYQEAVSILCSEGGAPDRVMDFVDRAKSMTLREELALRLPPLDPGRESQISGRTSLAHALPPQIAALEYFVTPKETFAFVWGGKGAIMRSLPLKAADLGRATRELLDAVRSNRRDLFEARADGLYRDLIDPISDALELQAAKTLVVLPDGPLHLLPFACLTDAAGNYLLQKYDLAYAPSRSVFFHCLTAGRSINAVDPVLLLDGTSNLAGASQELAGLALLFRGKITLAGAANLQLAKEQASRSQVIHFAGHAQVSGGRPRLVFPAPGGERYLEAGEIASWELDRTRLVSLAGCDTAVGPVFDGEAPWNLVPALLHAGAPAVLASLLPVDDDATRELTTHFYDLLVRKSLPLAEALRLSQLALADRLRRNNAASPYSWIPFVLIGDPR